MVRARLAALLASGAFLSASAASAQKAGGAELAPGVVLIGVDQSRGPICVSGAGVGACQVLLQAAHGPDATSATPVTAAAPTNSPAPHAHANPPRAMTGQMPALDPKLMGALFQAAMGALANGLGSTADPGERTVFCNSDGYCN